MRDRDPKDMVRDHLQTGEDLLWYGAPDVEAGVKGAPRGGTTGFLIVFAAILGLVVVQTRTPGAGPGETLREVVVGNPSIPFGAVATFVLVFAFTRINRARLRRYFATQAFGLTDRRVIVVEGDSVTSFAADDLDRPQVVERAKGYADVIFGRRRIDTGSSTRTRDPLRREERTVGFKAIPDAEEARARLETWIAGEIRESAERVSDFVETQRGAEAIGFATPTGSASMRHAASGMTIDYPDEWSVRVRKKKKPFGKTFFDSEKWKEPRELRDWTLVRLEGPVGCAVDAEVFETPLLADFDTLAHSRMAAMAGELIDSDPAHEQHGLRGFTVTHRSPVQANRATGASGAASVVTPFRHTILHDGRWQIVVTSKWPEESPELASAVDLVVRSIRIG